MIFDSKYPKTSFKGYYLGGIKEWLKRILSWLEVSLEQNIKNLLKIIASGNYLRNILCKYIF